MKCLRQTAKELILMDSKVVDFEGNTYRVSVLETTNPQNALNMKDSIEEELQKLAKEEGHESIFMFLIDILEMKATLLAGDKKVKDTAISIWGNISEIKENGKVVVIPDTVSRKKQIIPKLKAFYNK